VSAAPRPDPAALGAAAQELLDQLATISEPGPGVTRRFLTAEHRRAITLIEARLRGLGLDIWLDAAATLHARYAAARADAPTLLLGSHLDSVRHGGAYDGALGVVLPLICIEALARAGIRLEVALELVAFGDEEGSRFPSTLLGSRALAGALEPAALDGRDADGIELREALRGFGLDPAGLAALARAPDEIAGFVEVHIEQGPVLERAGLPVGIVTSIAAAARFAVAIEGEAGHAGTVPMAGRRDALCGAAAAILAVEAVARARAPAVGTVGRLELAPGMTNVIPGRVDLTLDLRAPSDAALAALLDECLPAIEQAARARALAVAIGRSHGAPACAMAPQLRERLAAAVTGLGLPVRLLASGAGHDAMVMGARFPAAMLFVRCRGGISHRPDELASTADIGIAARVLLDFLLGWSARS
jgi:allantoate deiminase